MDQISQYQSAREEEPFTPIETSPIINQVEMIQPKIPNNGEKEWVGMNGWMNGMEVQRLKVIQIPVDSFILCQVLCDKLT